MNLGQPTPILSGFNQSNSGSANSKLCCKFVLAFSCFASRPYFDHFCFCKLASSIPFSERCFALACGIHHVVLLSAKKHVAWIYAKWVIAIRTIMANEQAFGNFSVCKNPRLSMSILFFTSTVKRSVACLRNGCFPNPAFISFKNVIPKGTILRIETELVLTFVGAARILGRNSRRTSLEFLTALRALYFWHSKPFLSDVKGAVSSSCWLPLLRILPTQNSK